eukprot:3480193-Pyramimonas_sp.AAC.2
MTLAVLFGAHVLLEQPAATMLDKVPCVKFVIGTLSLKKVSVFLGGFGQNSLKPLSLWTSHDVKVAESFLKVSRSVSMARVRKSRRKAVVLAPTTNRNTSKKGKGWNRGHWVTGANDKLASSQAYPAEFCEAVCQLVLSQSGH